MAEASSGHACSSCGRSHGEETSCTTLVRGGDGVEETPREGCAPPGEEADPLLGLQFGSFRLVRRLGRGGMGTVYLGEHVSIGSRVAVKVLHEHLVTYPELVQRFHAEALAVNLIGHENIVSIFDLNAAPPRPYLIMEFLDGAPLSAWVGSPLPALAVVSVLTQVCDALQAAHARGIVHRDLKPDNIFLVRRGRGTPFVKVLDFGIAKLADARMPQTHAGIIVGTPEYMAPEQSLCQRVDGRADLYALGVIAYQLVTGRLPFLDEGLAGQLIAHQLRPPEPPRSLNPAIPAAVERVILRALAKTPDERYVSAAALRAALEEAVAEEGRAQESSPPPPARTAPPAALPSPPAAVPAGAPSPELAVQVVLRSGEVPVRLTGTDLSRGGLFLRASGTLPPLFARLPAVLELQSGPLSVVCEVVRHVTPEQARAWGMASPGFGVQFVDASVAFKAAVARLLRGELPCRPPATPTGDDPEAARVLESWRRRLTGDHYAVLALAPDADMEAVRVRVRESLGALEALRPRRLSSSQRVHIDAAQARVREAGETLASTAERALYDAWRGNHRGVIRCLEAGLTREQLSSLRDEYLSRRPQAASTARIHFLTGNALEREGQLARALECYERGLALDPLEPGLLQRARVTRRALDARAATGRLNDKARLPREGAGP